MSGSKEGGKRKRKESKKIVEIVSGTLVVYSQERRQRIGGGQDPKRMSVSHAMFFWLLLFCLFPCP